MYISLVLKEVSVVPIQELIFRFLISELNSVEVSKFIDFGSDSQDHQGKIHLFVDYIIPKMEVLTLKDLVLRKPPFN